MYLVNNILCFFLGEKIAKENNPYDRKNNQRRKLNTNPIHSDSDENEHSSGSGDALEVNKNHPDANMIPNKQTKLRAKDKYKQICWKNYSQYVVLLVFFISRIKKVEYIAIIFFK